MITRTYINDNLSVLKAVLESTGYFDSVTYNDPGTPTSIILKDAGGNTLAEITTVGITVYASAGTSQAMSFRSAVANTAYVCPGGTLIEYVENDQNPYHASVIITKTNDDRVAFVFSGLIETPRSKSLVNFYCIAWGDDEPIAKYENLSATAHRQTVLMPFPTNSPASHTVSAFFTAFGSFYTSEYLEYTLNGESYFTNGYWAIRDDGGETS